MKKILITILCIIMLFITIIQIRNTYALYKAEKSGEIQSLLGVWSIKVNEQDITSENANMTFEITDDYLHFDESNFVDAEAKVIAPGSEGYFDILIDATDTDVSVRYDLQISDVAKIKIINGENEEIFELTDAFEIEILSVEEIFEKIESGTTIIDNTTVHTNYIDLDNKKFAGVLPLTAIEDGYKNRLRIKFKWPEDANNEFHTMLGNAGIGSALGYSTGNTDLDANLINTGFNMISDAEGNMVIDAQTNTVDQMQNYKQNRPEIVIPVSLQLTQYMGEEITTEVATP